jgi:hypothetical protein
MRYWYDCEFIEDGRTIDLISIGVVAEDGREFYAISNEFDVTKAAEWVTVNVLSMLARDANPCDASFAILERRRLWKTRRNIRDELLAFVGGDKPEWWGYYSAYDHVALCQLFGTMMDLPKDGARCPSCGYLYHGSDYKKLLSTVTAYACNGCGESRAFKRVHGWPFYTRDIKQLCDSLGNPRLPEQGKDEHNALADARWNREAYHFLQAIAAAPSA